MTELMINSCCIRVRIVLALRVAPLTVGRRMHSERTFNKKACTITTSELYPGRTFKLLRTDKWLRLENFLCAADLFTRDTLIAYTG